ncbi:unnamed protein product, partial [Tetraodon nigroviridis]
GLLLQPQEPGGCGGQRKLHLRQSESWWRFRLAGGRSAIFNLSPRPHPQGDVCNPRLVNHIFHSERIDAVFHLAAQTHVESSFRCPSSFQRVNVEGTRVLLEAARGARHRPRRFVYVSTDEVYGPSADQVFDESSPLRPSNPYSATKAAAEFLVTSYRDAYQVGQTRPPPRPHRCGTNPPPLAVTRHHHQKQQRLRTAAVHREGCFHGCSLFLPPRDFILKLFLFSSGHSEVPLSPADEQKMVCCSCPLAVWCK